MFRTALGLGVAFFVIALIAALFGFGVVSAESWIVAKVFFFIFLEARLYADMALENAALKDLIEKKL